LDTVKVISRAPGGDIPNPYLGHVNVLSVAPSGRSNPTLGQVVVISEAPANDDDPWLGSVIES